MDKKTANRLKYDQIKSHMKKHTTDYECELKRLKEHIENDNKRTDPLNSSTSEKVPIYSIKTRVKGVNSIYLKSKRKSKTSFQSIEDYAGMRVLCLFEDDLAEIHKFLVELLVEHTYTIKEVNAYNWDEQENRTFIQALNSPLIAAETGKMIKCETRQSGYRSIHYIVSNSSGFPIEIQLRTLLQDVWGELEHALCYKKGDIHPHIKKSFQLFSQNLQSSGELMSHLRDISAKEKTRALYDKTRTVPRNHLAYEDDLNPPCCKEDASLQKQLNAYMALWEGVELVSISDVPPYLLQATPVLEKIKKAARKHHDENLEYWLQMEMAFLLFCEAKHSAALEEYRRLATLHPSRYCVHFRIGELLMIQGDIENSIISFDKSEELIESQPAVKAENKFRIYNRLAHAYWVLGEEYVDAFIEYIGKADSVVQAHQDYSWSEYDLNTLANNLCWYYLSKYKLKRETSKDPEEIHRCKAQAIDKFENLEGLLSGPSACKNMLDTAAWFCFNMYLDGFDLDRLKQAIGYCQQMGDKINTSSFNAMSANIHLNHIQEIMYHAQIHGLPFRT